MKLSYVEFMQKSCDQNKKGWTKSQLVDLCKELNLDTKGTKKELCTRLKQYYEFKWKNTFDWKIEEGEEEIEAKQQMNRLQKLPPEIILSIIKQMDLKDIRRLCSKYYTIKRVCIDNKNTIAQNIFERYNLKFSQNIKKKEFIILKEIYKYNKHFSDNWFTFLSKADLDIINFVKDNIDTSQFKYSLDILPGRIWTKDTPSEIIEEYNRILLLLDIYEKRGKSDIRNQKISDYRKDVLERIKKLKAM